MSADERRIVVEEIELALEEFFEVCGKSREAVSIALGYFPAWMCATAYGTHGLHPMDVMQIAQKHGLRMDWGGVRLELIYTCGMSESSAASMVREARTFEKSF